MSLGQSGTPLRRPQSSSNLGGGRSPLPNMTNPATSTPSEGGPNDTQNTLGSGLVGEQVGPEDVHNDPEPGAQPEPPMFSLASDFSLDGAHIVIGNVHNHSTPGTYPQSSIPIVDIPSQTGGDKFLPGNESYCSQLFRQKRGFPLYHPNVQQDLPAEYLTHGIAIGDVGTVTQDGSFDFYFNIFLPAGHPINANGVPTDFVPMEPYDLRDVVQHNYGPGAYVATPSVQDLRHLSNGTPIGRFVFRCEGPQGAILALPDGSHIRKLRDVEPMRAYAQEHAENWYEYINGARGRELSNRSLYLITGCEKARSWGIASYSAAHEGFLLTFEPGAGAHDSGYHWTTGGPALTKTSSPSPADSPTNQTTLELEGTRTHWRTTVTPFHRIQLPSKRRQPLTTDVFRPLDRLSDRLRSGDRSEMKSECMEVSLGLPRLVYHKSSRRCK
ncbi:hypothetical protein DFH06DRAFT_1069395 [Mycena polygramma]|nr:hypothetical protein DFH06DRAFT_1069395 [Mycena polygramma]